MDFASYCKFFLFLGRIEQISWITKKKFEEIWMTFLGILNLHNEDQVRPEEQASVIQVIPSEFLVFILQFKIISFEFKATCEAVRALTMVLQKNLPFMTPRPAKNHDLEKLPDFMITE